MGTLLFHVGRSGAPTAVQFAPPDRFHALPIVIGRLEPLTTLDRRKRAQTWTHYFWRRSCQGGVLCGSHLRARERGPARAAGRRDELRGAQRPPSTREPIRSGTEDAAGEELARIWLEEATLAKGFNVSAKGLLDLEGISTSDKILALLRRHVRPSTGASPSTCASLRPIAPESRSARARPSGNDVRARAALRRLRAPTTRRGSKRSSRGRSLGSVPARVPPVPSSRRRSVGAVPRRRPHQQHPIKYAIENTPDIDRVFVIVPYPALLDSAPDLRGFALVEHLVEVLVQERLYRDLREPTPSTRRSLGSKSRFPDRSVPRGVLRTLGWSERRRLQIVEFVRRSARGWPFDGFLSRRLREEYVARGQEVARRGSETEGAPPIDHRRRARRWEEHYEGPLARLDRSGAGAHGFLQEIARRPPRRPRMQRLASVRGRAAPPPRLSSRRASSRETRPHLSFDFQTVLATEA